MASANEVVGWPGCQLACEEGTEELFRTAKRVVAEPKMDGYRLNAVVGENSVRFFSRDDEEPTWSQNLDHLAEEILALGFRHCMLDGEIMGATWNGTGVLRSGCSGPKYTRPDDATVARIRSEIRFHVWDYVDLDVGALSEVKFPRARKAVRIWDVGYDARKNILRQWLVGALYMQLVEGVLVTAATLENVLQDAWDKGFEGLILKDADAPYVMTRHGSWQKAKKWKTFEVQIVEVLEGAGKQAGMMGSFRCVDANGQVVGCGTGFSDKVRRDVWARRAEYPGKIMEVRAQEDPRKVAVSRFTSFFRWRDDRVAL